MNQNNLSALSQYHPVVIEGMGSYDPRDPTLVAAQVAARLRWHWEHKPVQQPKLIVTQGDPLEERGISAITPRVAAAFGLQRGLVCLDEAIAEYHAPNADRDNVIVEVRYSQLTAALDEYQPGILQRIEAAVDGLIQQKNHTRKTLGKGPLKDYFRHFALLQEVTKAACAQLCAGITVIHTASDINEFSVTSFYPVGLELDLIRADDLVPFASSHEPDHET
ncbi:MAG: shikimate kinase [Halomonadaceae bacterium]|nr:MAG: shikimate kinase [Halomonadaceae bacterium]